MPELTDTALRWGRSVVGFLRTRFCSVKAELRPTGVLGCIQLLLNILSIFRLVLSIKPSLDIIIIPHVLRDIICVHLNDVVVVSIWLLLPIICARSFLLQLKGKPKNLEFRSLFYESLFGQKSKILKSSLPILILLCIPLSLWYILTIVSYIYHHWTSGFTSVLHPLQLYPAVFLFLQSLFQGCFLLWTFALPTFAHQLRKQETFQSDIHEYIYTNLVLIVHCVCLTVIAAPEIPKLYSLAIGEFFYRILAVCALYFLLAHSRRIIEEHTDEPHQTHQPAPSKTVLPQMVTSEGGSSRLVVAHQPSSNLLPFHNMDRYVHSTDLSVHDDPTRTASLHPISSDNSSDASHSSSTEQPLNFASTYNGDHRSPTPTYSVPKECSDKNPRMPEACDMLITLGKK